MIDCNVIVAGLVTRNDSSPTAQIVDRAVQGELAFLLSEELLEEYRKVLNRPRLRARHGKAPQEVAAWLSELTAKGTMIVPESHPPEGPDPNDAHLWRLLRARSGAVLVTGDQRLIDDAPAWAVVLNARAWLDRAGRP